MRFGLGGEEVGLLLVELLVVELLVVRLLEVRVVEKIFLELEQELALLVRK
jgi:hypothetical protein